MFRKTVADSLNNEKEFRFRGHEVRRIEAFSDAVFAFAVTLLIVSLEVPKTFAELMAAMRGFFAFGISFTLLMSIWYEQNIFFRRYGLDDLPTITYNCILIFLVLFYVYPLKFLFTLLFNANDNANAITINDQPKLMAIYGAGYIAIYFIFFLMYRHVLKRASMLDLTHTEVFDTKTKFYKNLIMIVVGIVSVVMAVTIKKKLSGYSGFVYALLGPVLSFFHACRAKRKRKIFAKQNNE